MHFYQIHKINIYLYHNKAAIDDLRIKIKKQQSEIAVLKDNLISLVRTVSEEVSNYMEELNCVQFFNLLESKLNYRFWHYSQLIDNILLGGLNGQSSMYLTPKLMDPRMIKNMIKQHSELNETIFQEHPFILYSMAKITLIEIDDSFSLAHFVLDIPLLFKKDNSFNLFKTNQVGTFLQNDSCSYFSLPKYVYENNNIFYDVKINDCVRNNAPHACHSNNLKNVYPVCKGIKLIVIFIERNV